MAEEYDPAFPTGLYKSNNKSANEKDQETSHLNLDDDDEDDCNVMATRNSAKKPNQPKETMVVNTDTTVTISKQLNLVEKAVSFSSVPDSKCLDSSPVDVSQAWPWMIPLPPGEPCINSSISLTFPKCETEQKVPSSNSVSEISILPEWNSNSNKSRLFNNSVENCSIDLVEVSIVNCNSVDSNKSDSKLMQEDAQIKGIENCADIPLPLSSVYDTDSCGSHSNSNVPSDSSVNSNRGSKTKFGKFKFLSDNGIDDTSSRASSVTIFRPDEPSEGPLSNDTSDSSSSSGHQKSVPKEEKSSITGETDDCKQSNDISQKESSDENSLNSNSNQNRIKTRRSTQNLSNLDSDNQDNSNSETPIIRRSSRIKSIEEKKEREKEQKEKGKPGKGKNTKTADKTKVEKDKGNNCLKDDKKEKDKDKLKNKEKDDKVKGKDKGKAKEKDEGRKTKEKDEKPKGKEKEEKPKAKEKEEKPKAKEKEEKPKAKEKEEKPKAKEKEEKPKAKEKEEKLKAKEKEEKGKTKAKDDKQKVKEENEETEKTSTEEITENEKPQEEKTNSVVNDDIFPTPIRPVPGTSPKLGKDSPQAPGTPQQLDDFTMPRPEKVKSRWRRSSEMERAESVTHDSNYRADDDKASSQAAVAAVPAVSHNSFRENMNSVAMKLEVIEEIQDAEDVPEEPMKVEEVVITPVEINVKEIVKEKAPFYEEIYENVYLSERRRSKSKKEVRRMLCDCTITKEEISRNQMACGEDCLNRLLMIECGSRCPTGDHCSNKRFQRKQYANVEIFKTELKGWGLRTKEDIPEGAFVMEYVGEVLDPREFKRRVKEYARDKNQHYYFMALKSDEIIDATKIGNPSRFINHSCSPNCETQKWTVNGELRIGFFTRCFIAAGEELTFDYQFQRYGKEAQKCFCGSSNCRGFIGGDKQTPLKREKKDTAPKRRKTAEERKREFLEDMDLEEEIEKLNIQEGLRNRGQTLTLSRLMVRAEDTNSRFKLLQIVQNTSEQACLRLFLDYHGLSLVWSWMVDIGNGDDSVLLKSEILKTLEILPVTNKTMLMDSKVMCIVQRWAHQIADHALKERDSETADTEPSSEPTSQSATPRHSDNNDSDRGVRTECINRGLLTPDRLTKVAAAVGAVARSEDTSSSSEEEIDESAKKRRRTSRRTALFDLPMFNKITDKGVSDVSEEVKSLEEKPVNKICDLEDSVNTSADTATSQVKVLEDNLKQDCGIAYQPEDTIALADVEMERKEAASQEFYSELEEGEVRDSLESTDKVKNEAESVQIEPLETDYPKLEEKEEGEILEKEDSSCQPRLSSQEGEIGERTEDDGNLKELGDISSGVKDAKLVADLAVKLLESWSNLKEAYRIPKREQNQNRREHEREADTSEDIAEDYLGYSQPKDNHSDQHEHELEMLAEKSRDRDWEYRGDRNRDHDRDRCRDRDRDRSYDNDSDWDRDRWEDSREYDRFDREIDKFKDNRKRLRSSPDKDHRHRDKRGSKSDDIELELEHRPRRPPLLPTPTDVERNGYLYKPNAPIRQPLLPTPPKLSKEERRQLFELKVQQEEAEEAMRKQHEEFLRQQHNSLMLDAAAVAAAAPPPLYYEPNFPPQPYYDPNQGYIPPPLPLPGDPSLLPQPPMPIHQLPPPTEPPPAQTPLLPNPTLDTMPPFDPSQPPVVPPFDPNQSSVVPPFDPSQPPVVYQQGVIYQQSQPSFIPPPTGQGPPPHTVRPPPPVQSYPPPSPAHFIPPVAAPAPAPTPPIYYPPQNVVVQQASPVATPAPAAAATTTTTAFPPPAVVHIPEQTGWTHAHLIPSLPSPRVVEEAPPPPEPPKPKSVKLPPNWKTAKDPEGRVYYYHAVTRQTQWEPPTWDQADDENDMDLGTPTYDEPKSKKKSTTTAAADTSSELAKRTKELFRTKMSQFIVQCLNPYRKPDCKVGRIISTEDFKHLARKLTHFVMAKELKHCRNVEDLECNDNVKHKAKDFVKKYMQKFGSLYRKAASPKDD